MILRKFFKEKKYSELLHNTPYFDAEYFSKFNAIPVRVNAIDFYVRNFRTIKGSTSKFFDSSFYYHNNNDVYGSNMPPVVHYILHGWKEGRSPSPLFNRADFLNDHPEIDPSRQDPAAVCLLIYGDYNYRKKETYYIAAGDAAISDKLSDTRKADEATWQLSRAAFDENFYLSFNPDVKLAGVDPFMHYMTHGFRENRDPSPEFDTYFYKSTYLRGRDDINPLLHYYSGSASNRISHENRAKLDLDGSAVSAISVCIHAHCFYPHLLGEIFEGIKNFPKRANVVISVNQLADRFFVEASVSKHLSEWDVSVVVATNQGRDLGPFYISCSEIWAKHEIVVHLHTKRSPHIPWGETWRSYLFDQVMGSKAVVEAALVNFERNPDLGLLYPDNYFLIKEHIAKNRNEGGVAAAADFLGLRNFDADSERFPAGSMFWCRTAALKDLVSKLDLGMFDDEKGQVDETFAHALERLLPGAVENSGFNVRSYVIGERQPLPQPNFIVSLDQPNAEITRNWPRDSPKAAMREPRQLRPPTKIFNPTSLNIHWIIPSFIAGSGGHMTIFRMIKHLEDFGHQQTIWIQNPYEFSNPQEARKRITDWYVPVGKNVRVLFLPENLDQLYGDVLIATDCWTAFPASQAQKFKERFYFIQDFEPDFHAAGSNRLISDISYDLGFSALCAGPWLEKKMQDRGLWSRAWELCADHDVYYDQKKRYQGTELQIALYARPYTPRRAVEIALLGMEVLAARGRSIRVHLFGENDIQWAVNFPVEFHGVLSHSQLSALYNKCDVGVVFSATNYSLIPLEMAACGLPVVELDVESTRAVFKNDEVSFARPTPNGVADIVEHLADNPEVRLAQAERAIKFVGSSTWVSSAKKIERALVERLEGLGFESLDPKSELGSPRISKKMKASIVIPTFNAGTDFQYVLNRVLAQVCDFEYDVLIVDSGSTDKTVEYVSKFNVPNLRLHTIPNSEFQHGRTRNLGISMTDGEYVAILTQDALPKNQTWLQNLITGFAASDRVAAVTGRHEAYPQHGPFIHNDMTTHFDALALLPAIVDLECGLPSHYYPGSTSWRMAAYFFSDNNSAVNRNVWNKIPYPEIEWGEDYVWASQVIEAGYQKVYTDAAVVFHSHDFPIKRLYNTGLAEGRFWMEEFGIALHHDLEAAVEAANHRDREFARVHGLRPSELAKRLRDNQTIISARIDGAQQVKKWLKNSDGSRQ